MTGIRILGYHDTGADTLSGKKHYHDLDFEILHIVSGSGTMMIKNKLYPISPDTIFFIRGNEAHCSAPENPSNYTRNKIIFSKSLLHSVLESLGSLKTLETLFPEGGSVVKVSSKVALKIDNYFLKLSENLKDNSPPLSFFINLFSILSTAEANKERKVSEVKNKISEVIEYINDNVDKKLTLETISNEVKISKYYLSHSFSSIVGMTLFEYITLARISAAKKLLSESDKSISEIAAAVGFDSFAYFSKVFREKESITPSVYRKQNKV